MSTPDDFETEGGDKATAASTTPKYYQVAVPSFGLNATTAPGDSFVRLGSFPDLTTTTESSLPGFPNSLALAKLVGDATAISTAETGTDTIPGGFKDGSGLPSPYDGKGDSNYLLGFADDTRYRAADASGDTLSNGQTLSLGSPVTNTTVNRKAETATLLTKGGWWDHSDGNRVTTTSGDKIEVIQGNYKLVVLGRQALPPTTDMATFVGNAFITDVSGGHFQEQYPSPTPCIKTVEYSLDGATGEWTLYQDNGLGNLITKLAGRTVDMFQGTKRETYVGSDPGSITGSVHTTDTTLDPVIISKTWAQKIETYTGAVNKPVPAIHSYTYADEIQNYTFAASHVNTTMGASAVSISGVLNTLEVVVGFKESVQIGATFSLKAAAELTVGITRTSTYCNSTTIEGGVENVAAGRTDLSTLTTNIAAGASNILGSALRLVAEACTMGNIDINLAEVNMMGI